MFEEIRKHPEYFQPGFEKETKDQMKKFESNNKKKQRRNFRSCGATAYRYLITL
jgi:hypothetical protein